MAKQPAKDQEKFVVRLPEGMRERIKVKADRAGMSMNEAIVWCLQQYFPEPVTIEAKIKELVEMTAILKGDNSYEAVDQLVSEVHDTIESIINKKVSTPINFRDKVNNMYEKWDEEYQDNMRNAHENPFDESFD